MLNRPKPHRRSIRLPGYDYSEEGGYFITICTKNRESLFGEIVDGQMRLNAIGLLAQKCWDELPQHYPEVEPDQFVIMPNHVHGIIDISRNNDDRARRGEVTSPGGGKTGGETPPLQKPMPTLGKIVAYYKYQTSKLINQSRQTPGLPIWQRNYYEHIIRSESSLNKIRQYIIDNPLNWQLDIENPANLSNTNAQRGAEKFWHERT